ncbi:MAG: DUF2062 domain-containing protein [Nitrospirales bacterium]|nr:DUF2062 domain-containing protein [Nitrospirales bacterium]
MAIIRSQFTEVLHLKDSPHRIAMAFSIGVFIAFSPTYGLHTVSALLCAWGFRLNYLAILLGAFINNPWTVVPILGATVWTGFLLLGMPTSVTMDWSALTVETLYESVWPYVWPFTLGGCVLGACGALAAYPLARQVLSRHRKAGNVSSPSFPPPAQKG